MFEYAMAGDASLLGVRSADWVRQLNGLGIARSCYGLNEKRDNFDSARGICVSIRLGVMAVKTGDDVGGPFNTQFEALALIAEVGGTREGWPRRFVAK